IVVPVDAGGDAVDIADEGSRATTNHAQANAPCAVLSHFGASSGQSCAAQTARSVCISLPVTRHLQCFGDDSAQSEHLAVGSLVGAGTSEVVEGLFGDADDVALDEFGTFARAVLGVLEG